MCRWTVTQGAPVAWFSSCLCCRPPSHLLSLSFILLLLLLGPPTSSSPLLASLSMNSEQNHNAQRPSFSHFFISHSPPSSTPPPPASSARLPWAINVSSSSTAIVGRHVRSSYKHLQGDVRKRKLVSFKYFFLRIGENGAINGTENEDDQYCKYLCIHPNEKESGVLLSLSLLSQPTQILYKHQKLNSENPLKRIFFSEYSRPPTMYVKTGDWATEQIT